MLDEMKAFDEDIQSAKKAVELLRSRLSNKIPIKSLRHELEQAKHQISSMTMKIEELRNDKEESEVVHTLYMSNNECHNNDMRLCFEDNQNVVKSLQENLDEKVERILSLKQLIASKTREEEMKNQDNMKLQQKLAQTEDLLSKTSKLLDSSRSEVEIKKREITNLKTSHLSQTKSLNQCLYELKTTKAKFPALETKKANLCSQLKNKRKVVYDLQNKIQEDGLSIQILNSFLGENRSDMKSYKHLVDELKNKYLHSESELRNTKEELLLANSVIMTLEKEMQDNLICVISHDENNNKYLHSKSDLQNTKDELLLANSVIMTLEKEMQDNLICAISHDENSFARGKEVFDLQVSLEQFKEQNISYTERAYSLEANLKKSEQVKEDTERSKHSVIAELMSEVQALELALSEKKSFFTDLDYELQKTIIKNEKSRLESLHLKDELKELGKVKKINTMMNFAMKDLGSQVVFLQNQLTLEKGQNALEIKKQCILESDFYHTRIELNNARDMINTLEQNLLGCLIDIISYEEQSGTLSEELRESNTFLASMRKVLLSTKTLNNMLATEYQYNLIASFSCEEDRIAMQKEALDMQLLLKQYQKQNTSALDQISQLETEVERTRKRLVSADTVNNILVDESISYEEDQIIMEKEVINIQLLLKECQKQNTSGSEYVSQSETDAKSLFPDLDPNLEKTSRYLINVTQDLLENEIMVLRDDLLSLKTLNSTLVEKKNHSDIDLECAGKELIATKLTIVALEKELQHSMISSLSFEENKFETDGKLSSLQHLLEQFYFQKKSSLFEQISHLDIDLNDSDGGNDMSLELMDTILEIIAILDPSSDIKAIDFEQVTLCIYALDERLSDTENLQKTNDAMNIALQDLGGQAVTLQNQLISMNNQNQKIIAEYRSTIESSDSKIESMEYIISDYTNRMLCVEDEMRAQEESHLVQLESSDSKIESMEYIISDYTNRMLCVEDEMRAQEESHLVQLESNNSIIKTLEKENNQRNEKATSQYRSMMESSECKIKSLKKVNADLENRIRSIDDERIVQEESYIEQLESIQNQNEMMELESAMNVILLNILSSKFIREEQQQSSISSYNQHITDNDHIYIYAIDILMKHIDIESSIVDFVGQEYVDILLTNSEGSDISKLKLLEKQLQTRSIVKRQLAFLKQALTEASQHSSMQCEEQDYQSMFKLNNCLEELKECIEMEFAVHAQAASNSSSIGRKALRDDRYNLSPLNIEEILKESCKVIFSNVSQCMLLTNKPQQLQVVHSSNTISYDVDELDREENYKKSETSKPMDDECVSVKFEYYEKYYRSLNEIISPILQNIADTIQGSQQPHQEEQKQETSFEYASIEKYLSILETSIIEFGHEMTSNDVLPRPHHPKQKYKYNNNNFQPILPNRLPKSILTLLRACCALEIKKRAQQAYTQLTEKALHNQLEHNVVSKEKEIHVLQNKLSQSRKQVGDLVMSVNVLTDEIEKNQRYYSAQLARHGRNSRY